MTQQTTEQAIAEIWELFRETDAKFKETDARFKETDIKITSNFEELDQQFKETDRRLDERFRQTSVNLDRLEGLFGNQWGRLVESLIKPGIVELFQERGHDVHRFYQRAEASVDGQHMEIDLLLENTTDVIPVEAKSNFSISDVNDFLDDLAEFTNFFPRFSTYQIYGAIAGLDVAYDVSRYAYKRGLYVVNISGTDMVELLNDEKFTPKDFGNYSP